MTSALQAPPRPTVLPIEDAPRGTRPGAFATLPVVAEVVIGAVLLASTWRPADALTGLMVAAAVGIVGVRAVTGLLRSGLPGLLTGLALGAVPVIVLSAADRADIPVTRALGGVGLLALACGSSVGLFVRRSHRGDRDVLGPVLVWTAVAGGLALLGASWIADLLPVDDPRLPLLMPYVAAAGGVLALAEILANHRTGAGRPWTSAAIGVVAVLSAGWLLAGEVPDRLEEVVQAQLLASVVAAVGLLVATATASPRPAVVTTVDAGDGPRLVGPVVVGLALVALAIRLVVSRPVWLDEAALARVSDRPLPRVLDAAVTADAHPPLFEVVLWGSQQLLGVGALALRIPSIVAGLLLVPTVYLTARELYDRRVAVVSAVIASVSPALIWLSGSARPGMLAALLATVSLWTMLRAVRLTRWSDWLLFAAASAALLATHQLGLVHVVVLYVASGLAALGAWRQGLGRRLVAGWAVSVALTGIAAVAVLAHRGGFGPPEILPPFEYATSGAPGAGRSVFGLAGTALVAVLGFHPPEVTSRLLALWPLCILATFVLFGRRWSQRGVLLIALALGPFLTLLALQLLDAPRSPPFALEWVATAVPMLAIGCGRGISLVSRWRDIRFVLVVASVVLAAAAADQTVRVDVDDRFDVATLVEEASQHAGRRDVVVYAPEVIGDLVERESPEAEVVSIEQVDVAQLSSARRVVVVGAFAFEPDGRSLEPTLDLVRNLAGGRELIVEVEHEEAKAWVFR